MSSTLTLLVALVALCSLAAATAASATAAAPATASQAGVGVTTTCYAMALLDQTSEYRLIGKLTSAKGLAYVAERDAEGRLTKLTYAKDGTPKASAFLQGAASVSFAYPAAQTAERRFTSAKGTPFGAEGVQVVAVTYGTDDTKTLAFYGPDGPKGARKQDWGGAFGYECRWTGDTLDMLPLDADGKPQQADHYRVVFSKGRANARRSFVSKTGAILPDYEGISTREYSYSSSGLLVSLRYLDASGGKVIDAYNVHMQTYEYDKQSRFKSLTLQGKSGNVIEVRSTP